VKPLTRGLCILLHPVVVVLYDILVSLENNDLSELWRVFTMIVVPGVRSETGFVMGVRSETIDTSCSFNMKTFELIVLMLVWSPTHCLPLYCGNCNNFHHGGSLPSFVPYLKWAQGVHRST